MEYEGRTQLGMDQRAIEVKVRIPDAENPEWFGYILGDAELPRGEVPVTLLDDGLYNAWQGTALVRVRDFGSMLLGLAPLEPPVGA